MAMISIDGVALPNPVSYKVNLQDLDGENTIRTENGKLTRDRIRAGIYRIDISWQVKKPVLKTITDRLKPAQFDVIFFNPTDSDVLAKTMYCGDRAGTLKSFPDEGKPDDSLWELNVQLIEY